MEGNVWQFEKFEGVEVTRFVQIQTKEMCGSLRSLSVLGCNKDHMTPI